MSETPPSKSSARTAPKGRLVLVVGASGVGKDTLIAGARAVLAGDPQVVFVRREITRPAEADDEDHLAVGEAEFEARRQAGGYFLAWRAHGFAYGLPIGLADELSAGRTVVANVSRMVLDEARKRVANLRVISIVADAATVAARLAARGREPPAEIAARRARADQFPVAGGDVVELRNEGSPADGVSALAAAILTT